MNAEKQGVACVCVIVCVAIATRINDGMFHMIDSAKYSGENEPIKKLKG